MATMRTKLCCSTIRSAWGSSLRLGRTSERGMKFARGVKLWSVAGFGDQQENKQGQQENKHGQISRYPENVNIENHLPPFKL